MAGDGKWMMDIIWHTVLLAGDAVGDLWSSWSTEILLVVSFVAQLVLTFTAGFRWRSASTALRNVIWAFYVGADYVATTALGHLSVSGTSGKRRLVAFWAPFFLLHLGGPDSITAYQLEDNQLSARYVLELVFRVAGALYIVYKSIHGSWVLVPASWLMLFVGVAKYAEKTLALRRANLANVRSSVERQRHRHTEGSSRRLPKFAFAAADDDGDLVMKAHALFHICKNSMVDSSVETASNTYDAAAAHTKETLFRLEWKQLFRVMEMELSLMYDFLYTKAAVIHTWHGYAIRVVSPVFTAVSLVLVELSNVDGRHRRSDVVITRVLLVATFLLETVSLLRAVGSTWTGFLLHRGLRQGWIRHEALCASRWIRFHRMVTSIGRLANAQAHRRWCGKMGQLSVLQLITRGERERSSPMRHQDRSWDKEFKRYSEKKTMVIQQDVKELVFRRVRGQLVDLRERMNREVAETGADLDLRKMAGNLRTKRGQLALQNRNLLSELRWSLGDELQLGILTWHIATEIYLSLSGRATRAAEEEDAVVARRVRAIRTLSDYMMYLLAVRPDMLPGLVTRKLLELTCEDLARIWSKHQAPAAAGDGLESSSSSSPGLPFNFRVAAVPSKFFRLRNRWRVSPRLSHMISWEELAKMLIDQWRRRGDSGGVALNKYLSRGVELAMKLLDLEAKGKEDMVQVILEVWVDMLFYASYRCSKESHAKQLSQGGELTTILWLVAEHVGLFIVSKTGKGVEEDNWRRRKHSKQVARTFDAVSYVN